MRNLYRILTLGIFTLSVLDEPLDVRDLLRLSFANPQRTWSALNACGMLLTTHHGEQCLPFTEMCAEGDGIVENTRKPYFGDCIVHLGNCRKYSPPIIRIRSLRSEVTHGSSNSQNYSQCFIATLVWSILRPISSYNKWGYWGRLVVSL